MKGRSASSRSSGARLRWGLLLLLIVAFAVVAAGCGGDDEEEAADEEAPTGETAEGAPAECPFEDGTIRAFSVQDLSAVIGEEIGPAGARAGEVWAEHINSEGGILGCEFEIEFVDDAFDVPTCLRLYREALASNEFDFFVGPTNSACMFSLDDLTNAAGKPLFTGIAADHQPYLEEFKSFNFHPSVSTFLEGRASARFGAEQGWKRAATIVPNYAYGQDAGKGFREYFVQIVEGGEIVAEQFPEFDEQNFTPFINPISAARPDGAFSAFFGPFVVPFWKQWATTTGGDIQSVTGLNVLATFETAKKASDVPPNTFGYSRADWQLVTKTTTGKELADLYLEKFPRNTPIVSEFAFQIFSSLQMAKAFIENTQSLEAEDWVAAVEAGDFTFDSPYHEGPTPVNPINHMADGCASVGQVVWNEDLPVPASYDPNTFLVSCMHDILPQEEAKEITNRDVSEISEEALAAYDANVQAAIEADKAAGVNPGSGE